MSSSSATRTAPRAPEAQKSTARSRATEFLAENGALVGLVAAIGMYAFASYQHLPAAAMLSLVVLLAMMGSCVVSGICGAFVPLVLKRLGADPVTASSIFLTTATDVVSMGMLLGLATLLVK